MDFNTPSMPAGKIDGAQRDQLMEQVKQQIAVANAQELLQVYTHKHKMNIQTNCHWQCGL